MNQSKNDFDMLHDIAPGKHFYQFYKSHDDLLKVLIPYWQSGVRRNEYCFWVIPSFLTIHEAKSHLVRMIPNIEELIAKDSFKIITHAEWYGDGTYFDGDAMIEKYERKLIEVLKRGFSVLRSAGDGGGFKPQAWADLQAYEQKGHSIIHTLPCIALCSYPLHDLKLQQTKDVLDSHHSVLVAKV